jgi:RHS repeat-associated protein
MGVRGEKCLHLRSWQHPRVKPFDLLMSRNTHLKVEMHPSRILYQRDNQSLRDFQYSYDGADQITQVAGTPAHTFGDAAVASTATNVNNQYTSFGNETLTYDASGNLNTRGQTTYAWDVRDRLISITAPGLSSSFSYDALGRRASKTVNGTMTSFTYDGPNIIQDSLAQYVHGIGIDDLLSRTTGTTSEYYLKDHLGSTISLTDNTGNITVQYGYSPFGQVAKTGSTTNYFTYTGREDDDTGTYHYRARYYSPDLKRFIAEDSLGFSGGQTNLYAYVSNNPVASIDPLGLYGEVTYQARVVTFNPGATHNTTIGLRANTIVPPGTSNIFSNFPPNSQILTDTSTAEIRYTPKNPGERKSHPTPPGRRLGDDNGHIVPRELGGSDTDVDNFFAQNRGVNQHRVGGLNGTRRNDFRESYRGFASSVRNYLDSHQNCVLTYTVELYYLNRGDIRPWGFYVIATFSDGRTMAQGFYNP